MQVLRKHFKITGTVQGVNFRDTSSQCAAKIGVSGWVRNNNDGSVEMEVQGTDTQINTLFDMIKCASSEINIQNIESENIPVDKNDEHFEIKE